MMEGQKLICTWQIDIDIDVLAQVGLRGGLSKITRVWLVQVVDLPVESNSSASMKRQDRLPTGGGQQLS